MAPTLLCSKDRSPFHCPAGVVVVEALLAPPSSNIHAMSSSQLNCKLPVAREIEMKAGALYSGWEGMGTGAGLTFLDRERRSRMVIYMLGTAWGVTLFAVARI